MALLVRLAGVLNRYTAPGRAPRSAIARWLRVRATTADGVVADVDVDVLLRPVQADAAEHEVDRALDLLENELRHLVLSSGLGELPTQGDFLVRFADRTVAGFWVEQAVVTRSEVSVTPELRRLVAPGSEMEPAWT